VNALATAPWPQPIAPLGSVGASALAAAIPLAIVMVMMGVFRRSGLLSSACGLLAVIGLAVTVWHMPVSLAGWSIGYGVAVAAWSILWMVFNAIWLYNLTLRTGSFDRLRRWIAGHASGDACIQAVLVAFCFGALLEGSAGFGAPVAISAFLLVGLGFEPRRAVLVSLVSNTAPVAFGSVGVPIIALASVTGLDIMRLSAMVGRQLPLLSLLLPLYLTVVVAGWAGLRRTWGVAAVAGASFALTQFVVSNRWGPYATDILSALVSIGVTVAALRLRAAPPAAHAEADASPLGGRDVADAFMPWAILSVVMVLWTHLGLFSLGQVVIDVPSRHHGVIISLYEKPYAARFTLQPLASGTAVLATVFLSALWLRATPRALAETAVESLRQLRLPSLTVLCIVGLAFLFNYSGMVYTLGAALAGAGVLFPFVSSFLGWIACFLTGSDTSSNFLFGNLQVAAARQLGLDPVLLAATNSSGAVAGKMISPQNISVGVSTVGLVGREGDVLRDSFLHSIVFAAVVGVIAWMQAYVVAWMIP
jgi:lactate permease